MLASCQCRRMRGPSMSAHILGVNLNHDPREDYRFYVQLLSKIRYRTEPCNLSRNQRLQESCSRCPCSELCSTERERVGLQPAPAGHSVHQRECWLFHAIQHRSSSLSKLLNAWNLISTAEEPNFKF